MSDPVLERWKAEETRLAREVERAEMEIQDLKHQLERVQIAAEEYKKLMSREGIKAKAPPPGTPKPERGEDMVLRLLRNVAPRDYSDEQVLEAMFANGWGSQSENPITVIQTYLSRLYRAGLLERPRKGRYRAKETGQS